MLFSLLRKLPVVRKCMIYFFILCISLFFFIFLRFNIFPARIPCVTMVSYYMVS